MHESTSEFEILPFTPTDICRNDIDLSDVDKDDAERMEESDSENELVKSTQPEAADDSSRETPKKPLRKSDILTFTYKT